MAWELYMKPTLGSRSPDELLQAYDASVARERAAAVQKKLRELMPSAALEAVETRMFDPLLDAMKTALLEATCIYCGHAAKECTCPRIVNVTSDDPADDAAIGGYGGANACEDCGLLVWGGTLHPVTKKRVCLVCAGKCPEGWVPCPYGLPAAPCTEKCRACKGTKFVEELTS